MSRLLTTAQACERLQVSRWTLSRWAKFYRVKVVRRGRVTRWPEASIEALIERAGRAAR